MVILWCFYGGFMVDLDGLVIHGDVIGVYGSSMVVHEDFMGFNENLNGN